MIRKCVIVVCALVVLGGCDRGFESSSSEPPQMPPPEMPRTQGALPPNHPPVPPSTAATPPARPVRGTPEGNGAGGLAWILPTGFVAEAPDSAMRAAQYAFPGENGAEKGTLAVFYFGPNMGGTVQDNIERWLSQLTQPEGRTRREAARIAHRTVSGMAITTVDVTGDFAGGMPGMPGAGAASAATNQRLIGAVVEGPEGLVFFKMMGPAATMDAARPAFTALIASLHPSDSPH
ncbi:MAG: hypothetical protein IPK60_05105 [Sandaracinaceae bacterium]|nr:hypothetical protein [Sandaracinaceae bacterium]